MKGRMMITFILMFAGLAVISPVAFSQSARQIPKTMASISGVVKDNAGNPVRGATVTATSGFVSVSRYTDQSGRYRIPDLKPGQYMVSATAWGYSRQDNATEIAQDADINFRIELHWDVSRISTSDWLSFFGEDKDFLPLEAACVGCHNLNRPVGQRGKTAQQWKDLILDRGKRGTGMTLFPEKVVVRVSALLAKRFGPDSPIPTRDQVQHPTISDAALKATIREYLTPAKAGAYILSVAVDSEGNAWFGDSATNQIGRLNPKTETFQVYQVPTPNAGLHHVMVAKDGKVWIANNSSNQLTVLEPKTGKLTQYKPETAGSPHVLTFDSAGIIWYTDNRSNTLWKFDSRSEKFTEYKVPVPEIAPADSFRAIMTIPGVPPTDHEIVTYGIAVDSHDKVWFCEYGLGKIARFDPTTEKFTEYSVPGISSLRGMAIDSEDNLWFANFLGHKLGKLNSSTGKVQQFQPPTRYASPYGVYVAKDGYVWYTDSTGDQITSFNPKTEEFVEYPLPTHHATSRFMGEDPSGKIWFSELWGGKVVSLDPGRAPGSTVKVPPVSASVRSSNR